MCWLEPQVEPTRLAEISRAEEANQKDTDLGTILYVAAISCSEMIEKKRFDS